MVDVPAVALAIRSCWSADHQASTATIPTSPPAPSRHSTQRWSSTCWWPARAVVKGDKFAAPLKNGPAVDAAISCRKGMCLRTLVISGWHAYLMYSRQFILTLFAFVFASRLDAQQAVSMPNSYLELMKKAAQHASANNAPTPVLSRIDFSVVRMKETKEDATLVPVAQLNAIGIRVVPWTTNDPRFMRKIIESGVDGLITDRPDHLQVVLAEEREAKHRQQIARGSSTSTCLLIVAAGGSDQKIPCHPSRAGSIN